MLRVYSNRSFYRGSIILSYTVWMWDLGNLGCLLMKRFRNGTWGTKSPNIFSTKYLNRIQDVVKMKKWFEDDMEFVTRPTAWDSSPTLKHLPGKPQDQKEFTTAFLKQLGIFSWNKNCQMLPPTSSIASISFHQSPWARRTNLPGIFDTNQGVPLDHLRFRQGLKVGEVDPPVRGVMTPFRHGPSEKLQHSPPISLLSSQKVSKVIVVNNPPNPSHIPWHFFLKKIHPEKVDF